GGRAAHVASAAARFSRAPAGADARGRDRAVRAARLPLAAPDRSPLHPRPARARLVGVDRPSRLRHGLPLVDGLRLEDSSTSGSGSVRRYRVLAGIVVLAFVLLGVRLWHLQVLR